MKLPSPAMGVALASLVIALGGTSYAASQVNGSDIKAKSIGNSKIKKNTIGPGTIKDGKLTATEFAPGVLAKATRWAYVDRNGAITAQSGGFTVVAAYPTLSNTAVDPAPSNALRANGNVYIDAGEDLTDNGIVATIQLQNTVNQDGGGMAGPRLHRRLERGVLRRDRGQQVQRRRCGHPHRDRSHQLRTDRCAERQQLRRLAAAERRPGHRRR